LLQFGSQGKAVTDLQMKLQQLGYYKGKIDGIYGRQTEAAVTQLQQAKGLKVDGMAGSQTWSTLQTLPTEGETPEKTTNSADENGTSEQEPFVTASPQGEAASSDRANVRTSVTFTGVPSKYLFLGWGIMFASGFIFILNDGIVSLGHRRLVKRNQPVVPPDEAIEATDNAGEVTPSLPTDSQDIEEEATEGDGLDPENSESDPRNFLKQIRESIDSAVEINETENSSPFGYLIPFKSAKGSPQKNDLPSFSDRPERSGRVRALLSDEKGNLYLSNPDDGASPEMVSVDLANREVIPLWANNGLIQPLKDLVVDLRAPLKFPMFGLPTLRSPQTPLPAHPSSPVPENAQTEKKTSPLPNDRPEMAKAKKQDIAIAADTFVTTLPLGNPRIGEAYSYTLVDDARGRFLLKGNELRMVNGDRAEDEANTSHTIVLRRTDAEGRSEEKSFKINAGALELAAFKLWQAFSPVQTVSS
jgi:hypothetical protein